MSKYWPATDLTGGGFGALDNIDGALLVDGDAALVIVPGGKVYFYSLDANSGAAESSPNIIAPDLNPGTKRWLISELNLGFINHLSLKANPTGVPTAEGTLFHDAATKMLAYKSDIAASTLNIGLEDWTRVRNETGSLIEDGTSVFGAGVVISPDTGEPTFLIVPALAVPGQVAIPGIVTSDILDDGEGFAVTRGDVRDYDTSAFEPLQFLYLSATTAGALTVVPPTPPNYAIPVGYVKTKDASGRIYIFSDNPIALVNATDAAVASGDPTGFHDNANIVQEYDPVARTITLTGDLKYSWRGQVKELTSPWTSDPHPVGLDVGYFLYSTDGKNFTWATTPWSFSDVWIAFAWHGTLDKFAINETHGLMPWQAHQEFHQVNGTYRTAGGTLGDYVLDSTVAAERRPTVAEMTVKDEDLTTINPALTSSLYTQELLTGAGLVGFAVDAADIVPLNGAIPYFNEFVSPNWVQTPMANNSYMSVWLVGAPASADSDSQDYRYLWKQGQTSGTLIGQQNLVPADLSLGNFTDLFTEFIFTAKVIIRFTSGNWIIVEVEDLTGTRASSVSSPSGNFLSVVATDDTLTGNGTASDPLGVLSSKANLTPANGETATLDIAANYDYTITPSGSSFTFELDNIPASGIAWSETFYAIDWDGVTVTLPANSVTSGGSGLSFTSGGGKDRIVVRGNSGPSGEKEFYNLPGDMQ